jgi:uncharacterized membrane protein
MQSGSLLTGVGVGAGLTYILDFDRGARRRARIRDTMAHSATLTRRAIGTTSRDARHRLHGTAASVRGLVRRQQIDDQVLVERVRAKLGRLVSHPHAIHVVASAGSVTLSGAILRREASHLIRATRRMSGVRGVIDNLDRHDQAGNVPSLQGGRAPAGDRIDIFQHYWSPTTRTIAGTAGAALVTTGMVRRDLRGASATLAGLGLLARAATNVPLRHLLGVGSRRRAVDIQKTIIINAAIGEVYAFWSMYENFPRFMSRVLEVRPSDRYPRQSHWRVAGPGGATVDFDAEITRAIPNQMVAWKTLPGSPVAHAGIVRFDPERAGGTRVHIRMSYNPPAGWLGHGVAAAFGVDPKTSMDADLVRMKTLIETGHAPHDAAQRETQHSQQNR